MKTTAAAAAPGKMQAESEQHKLRSLQIISLQKVFRLYVS